MTIAITPIYAAALALLMVALSVRVALLRGKYEVALGDGGSAPLTLAMRRFGNLAEYAPMAIVILLLMELGGAQPVWLHIYGACLVALRMLHPIALFDDMGAPAWRKAGRFVSAAGTVALMAAGAISLLL